MISNFCFDYNNGAKIFRRARKTELYIIHNKDKLNLKDNQM